MTMRSISCPLVSCFVVPRNGDEDARGYSLDTYSPRPADPQLASHRGRLAPLRRLTLSQCYGYSAGGGNAVVRVTVRSHDKWVDSGVGC
jgi:hypothetical protein